MKNVNAKTRTQKDVLDAAATRDRLESMLGRAFDPEAMGSHRLHPAETARLEHDDQVDLSVMGRILDLYFGGDLEASIALTGQVAGRIDSVVPVRDIVHGTVREFRSTLDGLARYA